MIVTAMFLVFILVQTLMPAKASADELTGRSLEKEMRAMIEMGIISGFEDGSIKPEVKVTREQFAALLERALDLPPGEAVFTDINGSKLATSINAINQAGLMNGYSDMTFKPKELITREQLMVTMKNVLEYSDMKLTEERIAFTDSKDFVSSGGIRATYYSIAYAITSGIENKGTGTYRFEPRSDASREQAAAFIYRFLEAKESYVKDPEPIPEPDPTPEPPQNLYQLASLSGGDLSKDSKTYVNYADAEATFNNNTNFAAIYRGNELIRVRKGFAYGNKRAINGKLDVTEIFLNYSDSNGFRTMVTGVEPGREMRYLESNDKYIKVQVGATIGYVKHSETELIPSTSLQGKDYYTVSQWGTLHHTVYNYIYKSTGTYPIGPAPSFMTTGNTYNSYDGVHYMNENRQAIGTHFPYFQFLSARSETKYTGAELDAYIMKVLAEKEGTKEIYKDATTKSKLIGMGKVFKQLEDEKHINALMMLSIAMHESNYGMSDTAQTCNNLFGLYKKDSLVALCPEKGEFDSPQEGATILVDTFLNPGYIEPGSLIRPVDYRANGAAFGNKTTGFNVRYASDPTWGSKAAGHMYTHDLAMGGKDYKTYKKIAITKENLETNVRSGPSINSAKLYTYAKKYNGAYSDIPPNSYPLGFPMTVVETVNDADGDSRYVWYKVFSDQFATEFGYIRSDVVNIISYEE